MIAKTTFQFLRGLKKNNDRSWVEANRAAYDNAKADFQLFAGELIKGIAAFDPSIANASLEAKQVVSRLNRDIRFSKNKAPYKSNFFASIAKGGKKGIYAGYYIHVEPGRNFAGGGLYQPMPPELKKVRQEIDYNFDDWQKILKQAGFKKTYPRGVQDESALVRTPKGFEDNHPAIEFLKMKNFYTYGLMTDEEMQSPKTIQRVLQHFRVIRPMLDFLNHAMD